MVLPNLHAARADRNVKMFLIWHTLWHLLPNVVGWMWFYATYRFAQEPDFLLDGVAPPPPDQLGSPSQFGAVIVAVTIVWLVVSRDELTSDPPKVHHQ